MKYIFYSLMVTDVKNEIKNTNPLSRHRFKDNIIIGLLEHNW